VVGDVDGDGIGDLVVGASRDDDGGINAGAVYVLGLETNGTVKNAQKISTFYGNFATYYTLNAYDDFGISVASLGDLDSNTLTDLAVGAIEDSDGGTSAGAVYILFLNASESSVESVQKLSMLHGNFNSFYTLSSFYDSNLGSALDALGDIDGDGVEDLAAGAYAADDGGTSAGEVFIFFLRTDGNIKNAQKISALYGGLSTHYSLSSGDIFGGSVAALGDIDGDGVMDLAVGAWDTTYNGFPTGAALVVNLAQSYCETSSAISTGTCYHHTSTVTRLAPGSRGVVQVPLTDVTRGQRVLALDHSGKPIFAKVEDLPHGPAEESYVHIVMAGKAKHELKVTLHHTFDACLSKQHPVIRAMDLRAGDCLHTTEGRATVHSAMHVASRDGDETYSIKLAGDVGTVAIGGVFTHAIGHIQLKGAHSVGARADDRKKPSSKSVHNVNGDVGYNTPLKSKFPKINHGNKIPDAFAGKR
jgi:hypothetical protein